MIEQTSSENGTTGRQETGRRVRETLAEMAKRAPGRSVELRVPPYGAVQIVEGATHRRGTPRAVVEMDADTWLALASGALDWAQANDEGLVDASGEGADLSPYLPLGH